MSNEDVLTNYNAIGIDVIERMYSDGYLSIGGDESTREQARLGGIAAGHQVLDVGSGLGGPACLLAGEFGCNVTGLDLVELNVAAARKAANASGVSDATRFVQGDATAMDFADAEFDVVCGQDAWCHVDDKAAFIAECARPQAQRAYGLRDGSRLARWTLRQLRRRWTRRPLPIWWPSSVMSPYCKTMVL